MYPAVIFVKAISDYRLLLTFDNNEKRVFDVKPVLDFGSFSQLKDESVFKSVRVVCDSIEWCNGLDLDPEYLYEKSVPDYSAKL